LEQKAAENINLKERDTERQCIPWKAQF